MGRYNLTEARTEHIPITAAATLATLAAFLAPLAMPSPGHQQVLVAVEVVTVLVVAVAVPVVVVVVAVGPAAVIEQLPLRNARTLDKNLRRRRKLSEPIAPAASVELLVEEEEEELEENPASCLQV